MNKIIHGLMVVLVTIALFAVTTKTRAGTSDEFLRLMSDKVLVYQGVCWFDKKGVLTFDTKQQARKVPCVVGFEPSVTTKHYVVICNDEYIAQEVVIFDEADRSQKRLWRLGTVL